MPTIMARDSCKPVSYYQSYTELRRNMANRTNEEIERARTASKLQILLTCDTAQWQNIKRNSLLLRRKQKNKQKH